MNRGTHQYLEDPRNENILIYINGEIVPRSEAKISVFDSGFLLGDGVWEGIRLHNGKMVFLEKHLNRIYKGAEELAITIGKTKDELTNLLNETIQANGMKDNVHIRLIISRGLKKTPYQHPNANVGDSTIVIIPEYKIASKEVLKEGIRVGSVSIRRGTKFGLPPVNIVCLELRGKILLIYAKKILLLFMKKNFLWNQFILQMRPLLQAHLLVLFPLLK